MENAIEMEVKTKKWQQFIFEIAGVEEHVEEEEKCTDGMGKLLMDFFLLHPDMFGNEYTLNSRLHNTRLLF